MDLVVFSPEELPVALRALANVARANGSITSAETALFDTLAQLHGSAAPAEFAPVRPEEVSAALRGKHQRHRLLQLAIVTAMTDGDPTPAQESAVRALAEALGEQEAGLTLLHDVAKKQAGLARFDLLRRMMLDGRFLGDSTGEKLGSFGKMVRALSGFSKEDEPLAWRFKSLGLLPEGTLGRAYWSFCTKRRFLFPGEPGKAILERTVFHDFGHVLSGYDTTLEGEMRMGSFQAGNRRDDGFVFLLFVLTQMHLGIDVNPAVQDKRGGLFDPPSVLEAVARGAACKVDLSEHWDFWAVVDRPLAELRREYGIRPPEHRALGIDPESGW